MDREALIQTVRSQMPEKRWEHTLGVIQTSILLAKRYGADPNKAELAAILHDAVKYWPVSTMAAIIKEQKLPQDLLEHSKNLWHAPVGAFIAERDYGVKDLEILDAIRYHTSGRVHMTLLDKVVCLADYIEPGRNFPGVNEIRTMAETNLERALVAGFDSTISFLLALGERIYPLTVMARNGLLIEIEKTREDNA